MIERQYAKIEIDNAICKRRFHIAFEIGSPNLPLAKVKCPHCDVTVFEMANHPQATLVREENLVKTPDGTNPIIAECRFSAK